jgi:hypothetical protein
MKQYQFTYEELEGDRLQIEVLFDYDAEIGSIFVYNFTVDAMVSADVIEFQKNHPYVFNRLQEKVYEQLQEIVENEKCS